MSYYVYGIVDPTEVDLTQAPTKEEQLGAVIYVGKGTGNRMDQHLRDAQYLLEHSPDSLSVAGRKLNRLAELLQAGTPPKTIKLMAGFENEVDAYRAEAFAIEAVNAVRMSKGRSLLTNAVKGHGVAMEDLGNYMDRLNVEQIITTFDSAEESILVVLRQVDLVGAESVEDEIPDSYHTKFSEEALKKIVYMSRGDGKERRRGWDRHNSWSDDEARERARKYWEIGYSRVNSWLENPETMPKYLMAGVQEAGKTIIRYIWEIDREGVWEAHDGNMGKIDWGIPLGKTVEDHPYMNTILYKTKSDGSITQVLQGNSSGIKIAKF